VNLPSVWSSGVLGEFTRILVAVVAVPPEKVKRARDALTDAAVGLARSVAASVVAELGKPLGLLTVMAEFEAYVDGMERSVGEMCAARLTGGEE